MKKIRYLLMGLSLGLIACQQDGGDELSLIDLQKDEIKELNKYKFKATVDVFPFNTSNVAFVDKVSRFEIQALGGTQSMNVIIPYLGITTFYGSNDGKVEITHYSNANNRYFTSKNAKLPSNAVISITSIDTTLRTFSGTFSGTLYDYYTEVPQRRENQLEIHAGQLINVAY